MLTQRTTDVDSVIMQYCDDGTLMTSVQTDNERSFIHSIELYWAVASLAAAVEPYVIATNGCPLPQVTRGSTPYKYTSLGIS